MKRLLSILFFMALFFVPDFSFGASLDLIIYSVQVSGAESSTDEFVSIKNISSAPINLEKYTISKKTATGTTWSNLIEFGPIIIAPGQAFVIGHANSTAEADYRYSSSSYSIAPNNAVSLRKPDKTIVDLLGFGDSISFEGSGLVNPEAGQIYQRISDIDNDNSVLDFILVTTGTLLNIDPNVEQLTISEIMPNPSEGSEWFELYNPTSQPVSLAGLKICDGMGATRCYYFKNEDTLSSFEYKSYSRELTKITLNNNGDYLELVDPNELVITDSGGNYGVAERGLSLSLFGSEFKWTSSVTKNAMNIFTEIPVDDERTLVTKKTSTKTKKLATTRATSPQSSVGVTEDDFSDGGVVAGAKTSTENQNSLTRDGFTIDNKILGMFLILLSILLILGYNLWLKREQIAKIYNKIRTRNN